MDCSTPGFPIAHQLPGEGNGNPIQYSCLENPVDRGALWDLVHRVAQSRTQLKQRSRHACIGEGNGNPLQSSCLENPRDGGAWWAAAYGVTQSWTLLKWLSSSSGILPGSTFSSVQFLSCVWLFATPWTPARQASLFITNSGACSNSCPSSQWRHPTISSSVIPLAL